MHHPFLKFVCVVIGFLAPAFRFVPAGPALSWTIQTGETAESLRGVSAVDEETAWASGTRGTVLRTIDGGKTWTAVSVPGAETIDFRDVEGFDSRTAVVMGVASPAKIFRTGDGGRTWTLAYENNAPGIFLDGMAFFDAKNGLAVGDPMDGRFMLIETTDGGKSWSELPEESRPAAGEGEAAFAASGTSLFALGRQSVWLCTGGPKPRIFRSRDRGRHWEPAPSSLREGLSSTGGFSVFFFNELSGIIVGGDYRDEAAVEGNAALSSDGGKSWTPVSVNPPGGFREAVAAGPGPLASLAVAVGPSGSDYSLDLGKSWIPISGPAGFHSLSFAKKGRAAWAVGRKGLIARLKIEEMTAY